MRSSARCSLGAWALAVAGVVQAASAGLAEARPPAVPASPAPESPLPPTPAPPRPILVVADGVERFLSPEEAATAGYARLSLREDWTPFIFHEPDDPTGQRLPNRYRSVFLGLAQDRTDGDGQPLPASAKNYLELFGIPPTLAVLRERFLADSQPGHACESVDYAKIRAVTSVPARPAKGESPEKTRSNRAAFLEVEKRLRCEGMFAARARHAPGVFDDAMRDAVVRFQQKNKLYDATALKPDTMAALGKSPLDNDYDALVRSLTERVASAANVLEDGSVDGKDGPPRYTDESGRLVPVRNVVAEAVQATLAELGLGSTDAALAFFHRHPASDFDWLEAAVRLPTPPAYYSPHMDLSVEIDRGDVIYDPLYDEKNRPTDQTRRRFPMLTLRVRWQGQLIPLVRWRTTIGGWRSDLASNGYEYYRYKGSDVGPRVWRNVVAGPVWIAPNSTPIRTLVKSKDVAGSSQWVVNYDEVGPGYLSAYGLVAAYNVVPGKDGKPDWDNGVRVHGSSEYLSIRNPNAYSHGCHRLMNHLAVRLFSFVLQHRHVKIIGERALGFSRQYLWKDDVFEMRLPSRGFHFEFEPPVPVNVLEGTILGKHRTPVLTYMPKPEVVYPPGPTPIPPDLPESRAGGGE